MKKKITTLLLLLAQMFTANIHAQSDFTLGADISWYSEMKDKAYRFSNGTKEMSCPELLADYGMNAARLRVWVNPTKKYNGKNDVIAKAREISKAGLDLLIDFHMSDTWADPGSQTVPAAWKADNYTQMKAHLHEHVVDILTSLQAEGITPRWVQIGNETNDGMLWDMGKASTNPTQYAGFIDEGYKAVKEICPETQVIVHISNANENSLFSWNLGVLMSKRAHFDLIGMSLYPGNDANTSKYIDDAMSNIRSLYKSLNKKSIIVETGVNVNSGTQGRDIIASIIDKAKHSTNNACLGVLYWEPEAPGGWSNYQLGAASLTGKVIRFNTIMDAFKQAAPTAIETIPSSATTQAAQIYNLQGQRLTQPQKGICIINGKKVLVK